MVGPIRVFIATTEGPSEILAVTTEDSGVRSVVCLNGTSEALPISRDYDSFVRKPTGVIERLFGHASFRVDVAERISNGTSWQLGMLVAHCLYSEGLLAVKGSVAVAAFWVTGEVRNTFEIAEVEHIEAKVRQSRKLFDSLTDQGVPLTLVVPDSNEDAVLRELPSIVPSSDLITVFGARHWDDVIGILGARNAPSVSRRGKLWGPRSAIAILAVTAITGAAVFWRHGALPEPVQTHSAPVAVATPNNRVTNQSALMITALESRAPAESSCGRMRLVGGTTVDTEIPMTPGQGTESRSAKGLCDVKFRLANTSTASLNVWINLRATSGVEVPKAEQLSIPAGGTVEVEAKPDPWAGGKPWSVTLIVASNLPDGAQVDGELAELGSDTVLQRLVAIGGKPKTVAYSASEPGNERFH